MQANSAGHYTIDTPPTVLGVTSDLVDGASLMEEDAVQQDNEATCFHGCFESCMEMYVDAKTVAAYMDAHREWFPRCAQPMKSEPIGENGYALTIGRFGSFGYEVEPKVGLNLLPQDQGVYRIETIPVPGYYPPGYDVDFNASMHLVEVEPEDEKERRTHPKITRVEWDLDLKVMIQFPRFINALPKPMVQSTGDRLLNQIVRQVSRRLTQKVQQDFHATIGVTLPKKRRHTK